jgi:glycosyltransferase involved in cell wall biosynthesis
MERRVIHGADKVLTTTARLRTSMMQRYPGLPEERFACIPNGIDASVAGDHVPKYGPLTITYAGTLYLDRTPEPLFEALGALVRERSARTSEFRVILAGNCRSIGDLDTMAVAKRHGVEEAIEIIDRLPRGEVVQIMRMSHLLLVLAPQTHEMMLPAKIFDYLGSGSKLLALAGPGATADLMMETGAGRCFSPANVSGLKDYLRALLVDRRYEELRNEPGRFTRYDARTLTSQLVAELSDATPQTDAAMVRP